jgi:uncharacterized protein DUF2336
MIVRQFLQWVRAARPGERAEATSALARAYLHSDCPIDDLAAAEGAMIMLLDDPSPLVRRAMAEVFASSQKAPPVIVHALASDQLIDLVRAGKPSIQIAIAGRPLVTVPVAAALAEVACSDAWLALLENSDADIALASVERIVDRFGHVGALRENLLARDDLPMPLRQTLLSKLSQSLVGFVTERQWLGPEHAEYAAREAREKATLALATETAVRGIPRSRAPLARERPTHGRHAVARAALRQSRVAGGSACRTRRRAGGQSQPSSARAHDRRPARALSQGRAAGACLSSLSCRASRAARRFCDRRAVASRLKRRVSSTCSSRAARRVLRKRCLPCCADSRWKRRAKKRGCSAMNWSPMSCRFTPCNSTKRGWWPEALFLSHRQRRRFDFGQHFGAAAILREQIFIGDFAQTPRQHRRQLLGIRARIFGVDRTNGIDVLFD